jgi:demethoxyubiquinone hydroxylase (CLK1/Coq7/Cat5 family)
MGHYDTQIEQHNDDDRKRRREELINRIDSAVSDIENDELEQLALAAENWYKVIGFVELVKSLTK